MTDLFQDISYLQWGTPRQRAAYTALQHLRVFEILRAYSPILAGTIPLDLDLADSDLDLLCEVYAHAAFQSQVVAAFGHQSGFQIKQNTINDLPVILAQFVFENFPIEIFGQPRPVRDQNGYRHLVVEARLLALDDAARDAIRSMKRAGLKTEPAFARYFNLPGNPYETLFEFFVLSETELRARVAETQQGRPGGLPCVSENIAG